MRRWRVKSANAGEVCLRQVKSLRGCLIGASHRLTWLNSRFASVECAIAPPGIRAASRQAYARQAFNVVLLVEEIDPSVASRPRGRQLEDVGWLATYL